MNKYGTLQIRINLTKTAEKRVIVDGPVSVYDQAKPGLEHLDCLTSNPMGTRINGGWDDLKSQISNAIKNAGYELDEV
ncbi:MAG: hypothetical protein ACYC2I_05790 [Elusimicrobiales bacterium]